MARDTFAQVGQLEAHYAGARQQESQFARGQLQQAGSALQQQGQFHAAQQQQQQQFGMQLKERSRQFNAEILQRGQIEALRREDAMREAQDRMTAKMMEYDIQDRAYDLQFKYYELEKLKFAAQSLRAKENAGITASAQEPGDLVEINGQVFQHTPRPGSNKMDLKLADKATAARFRETRDLEQRKRRADVKRSEMLATGEDDVATMSNREMTNYMNAIRQAWDEGLVSEDEAMRITEEITAEMDRRGGFEKPEGPGGVSQALGQIAQAYQGLEAIVGQSGKQIARSVGMSEPQLQQQMQAIVAKYPNRDPQTVMVDYMNYLQQQRRNDKR